MHYPRPVLFKNSWGERAQWLERELTKRKFRDLNLTPASRLPLSRLGQPGSIPALMLPSIAQWLRHKRADQKVCGPNSTSESQLLLSRLRQPGITSASDFSSNNMAVRTSAANLLSLLQNNHQLLLCLKSLFVPTSTNDIREGCPKYLYTTTDYKWYRGKNNSRN
ncbi:hypothetical protein CSKR_104833 [Clonorchis sinensis]|uniref:Uncharacterized protein n=1 Tax=Clonorchis sinensis TaxID=79923 RepID=A0A3R7JRG2_CLOSI|nr:hypothetical protein CSKR_104833 [Clonorchis sinensis]